MFLKNITKMEDKMPIKTVYFLGVRRLTTSSYTVYDYTTSGHMDLSSISVLYIESIYISIEYPYNSIQYISNAIKM